MQKAERIQRRQERRQELEQLFENLRRLRQCIEFAVVDSGWYQVVPCTFRGRLNQHRGFDFQKIVLIEVVAGDLCNLMAQDHLFLQSLSAQVQVAVF